MFRLSSKIEEGDGNCSCLFIQHLGHTMHCLLDPQFKRYVVSIGKSKLQDFFFKFYIIYRVLIKFEDIAVLLITSE